MRFAVNDKVILIKNTPFVQEGFIGFVNKIFKAGPCNVSVVAEGNEQSVWCFNEDELELLSPAKKEAPLAEYLVDMFSKPDRELEKSVEKLNSLLEAKPASALDKQVSGNHYKDCKIQPIEYIQANGLSYLEGNVIKYTTRHSKKNGKADIEKAIHYLELILEMEYKDKE